MEPVKGVEPLTCGLRNRCSATELHRPKKQGLHLQYSTIPLPLQLAGVNWGCSEMLTFRYHVLLFTNPPRRTTVYQLKILISVPFGSILAHLGDSSTKGAKGHEDGDVVL